MSTPYYDPDNFGLVTVGEISFNDDSYQFDLGVVWFHRESGTFFYAEDSGCSCPSPFEDFHELASLGEPLSLAALMLKLRSLGPKDWGRPDTPVAVQAAAVIDRARELAATR